eukprot:5228680-Pleurochrysis_carterae.AAC.2
MQVARGGRPSAGAMASLAAARCSAPTESHRRIPTPSAPRLASRRQRAPAWAAGPPHPHHAVVADARARRLARVLSKSAQLRPPTVRVRDGLASRSGGRAGAADAGGAGVGGCAEGAAQLRRHASAAVALRKERRGDVVRVKLQSQQRVGGGADQQTVRSSVPAEGGDAQPLGGSEHAWTTKRVEHAPSAHGRTTRAPAEHVCGRPPALHNELMGAR